MTTTGTSSAAEPDPIPISHDRPLEGSGGDHGASHPATYDEMVESAHHRVRCLGLVARRSGRHIPTVG
jgi:hypothetical protein